MNIVVVGSINTDLVINTNRVPKIGETISGNGFAVNCGGKGVNQAVAAAKLGGNITFIGAAGNDENGNISIKNLENNGIDTKCIARTNTNTGVAVITVCNGDNCIILDSGANNLVSKELIDRNKDVILSADAVVMQLEIPIETVTYVAKIAHSAGVKVILNPAPIVELPSELLQNTDVFILNETEAEFVTKVSPDTYENRQKCMSILKEYGIGTIVLTLGADGAVYTDENDIKHQKAFKAEVVDTTAAGDTFIGAFCMKMNEGIETAMKYATAASSITVSRKGASKSIPSGAEVDELLKSIG
ncbi:MAG: ribokinase [Clostridia bacterium]|nr:ribokinase [Clostridia bacterium]